MAWLKAHQSSGGGQGAAYIGNNLDGSGNMVTDNGTDNITNQYAWNTSFTCPGSGSRTLDDLGIFGAMTTGTGGARLALYTGAGAFVCQTAQLSTSSTSA